MPAVERLDGIVRAYDWGDREALADLLGHTPSGRPEAEYWLGAHPSGPAVLSGSKQPLDRAIAADPTGWLGQDVAGRFGHLPFLVKILAARRALSIQAHPSAEQAAAGFAREERDGPDRDAPNRTYRDSSHKPELVCALTPFEARCGFRDPSATLAVLDRFGPSLEAVRDHLAASDPADTALWLLGLPSQGAQALARAAVEAATERIAGCPDGPGRSELASTIEIGKAFPDDVGVVVALLLNHVVLAPGQALFLGAGNVHAYLRGVAVEVMANSDNVIRGGLTPKHIDVDELAAIVDRSWGPVPVQSASAPVHTYEVPVPDFSLTRIEASAGSLDPIEIDPTGPEIVLVTAGSLAIETPGSVVGLGRGQAAFLGPGSGPGRLRFDRDVLGPAGDTTNGRTLAWRVTVGRAG